MKDTAVIQKNITFNQYQILIDIHLSVDSKHTVILLAALGVTLNKYKTLITALTQNNFTVIVADYPNCGRNTPHITAEIDYGYLDLLNNFIPQLEAIALEIDSELPILLGHSLGGHLATLYAQNHSNKVVGIATGNIGFKNWDLKGKVNILKATVFINLMLLKDGFFAGYKIGFGHIEAKSLMRDWSKVVFTGNYAHICQHEKVISNNALFIHFKEDDFAPMKSTLGLSCNFQNPEIKTLDFTKKVKGNQHSAWIKQPDEVIKTIQAWLYETT